MSVSESKTATDAAVGPEDLDIEELRQLLPLLRCPDQGGALRLAQPHELEKVNQTIANGEQRDAADQTVTVPVQQLLINESGMRAYPVRFMIPSIVIDESLVIQQ
ncbi:MAG: Trm112 family protein [Planctomycetota bacterium]